MVTVHPTWSTTNISIVRLGIDQATVGAYSEFYDEYPAANGSADVPFACSPPNYDASNGRYYHLYVLMIKSGTFSSYKSWRVYA